MSTVVEASAADAAAHVAHVAPDRRPRRIWSSPVVPVVVLAGLVLIGLLSWLSWRSYVDNENRLLGLKAKEAASVLTASLPSLQTPLAVAAQEADSDGGSATGFRTLMMPYVGPKKSFVSATLWSIADPASGPVASVGSPPDLASDPQGAAAVLGNTRPGVLNVSGILRSPALRLGYAYRSSAASRFVVYAEIGLPPDRRARIASNSAFSDIHYAIYRGSLADPSRLLATDVRTLPIGGRHRVVVIPFGTGSFTLVVSPRGSLSGGLSQRLPWIIAILGAIGTVVAALIAERLVRGRRQAEALAAALDQAAAATADLYSQQRSIAQTLQQALLPERLPTVDGAETACRYVPGTRGMEVGGDWYDLVPIGAHRAFFVVGDVSGRGVQAAAVMARLRFATLAYAQQCDPPEVILGKLSRLISFDESDHFATVVCGIVDITAHQVHLASAGHLPVVIVEPQQPVGRAQLVNGAIGLPVGVAGASRYSVHTAAVPEKGTLLAFTDGLVERRGEPIDASLKRLAEAAASLHEEPLEQVINDLVEEFTRDGIDDDAAILGVRWLR